MLMEIQCGNSLPDLGPFSAHLDFAQMLMGFAQIGSAAFGVVPSPLKKRCPSAQRRFLLRPKGGH